MILPVTSASPLFPTIVEVADTDYTVTQTHGLLIVFNTLTAGRTVTLPASSLSGGQVIRVMDATGNCGETVPITIMPDGADTINGESPLFLASPFASTEIVSNGSNGWTISSITPDFELTKDPTGFSDPPSVVTNYDSASRTVTLSGAFSAYWHGAKVQVLTNGWVSPSHGTANGSWFLFYDGAGFVWQQTPWTFDMLMVAYVFYGATDKFALRECHGLMPWQVHGELHSTIGTYYNSGGGLSGYTLASTVAANRRPGIAATVISDEDITTTVPLLPSAGPYTVAYLTSTGTDTFATAQTDIVPLSGSNPYWNSLSGSVWGQTLMSNNSYMSVFLIAVPATADATSQLYRYLWVQGQSNGTLASQQALNINNMSLGDSAAVFTEFVPIAKVIIRYTGGNWSITQVDRITGTRVSSTSTSVSGLTTVAVTAPITGDGTATTPLAMAAATASVPGYLTSADWSTFNGKQPALGFTPIDKAGDTGIGSLSLGALTATTGTFGGDLYSNGLIKSNGTGSLNLHLDSTEGGNSIYLNFYGGSGGTFFGDGASGVVASISGTGGLSATTGVFSGSVTTSTFGEVFRAIAAGTPAKAVRLANTGCDFYMGIEGDDNSYFGTTAYSSVLYSPGNTLRILTPALVVGNSSERLTVTRNGSPQWGMNVFLGVDKASDEGAFLLSTQYSGGGRGSLLQIRRATNSTAYGGDVTTLTYSTVVDFAMDGSTVFAGALAATTIQTGSSTVAALPAGSIGMRYMVTDALSPVFMATVVGGGAVVTPVYHDGVSWKVG